MHKTRPIFSADRILKRITPSLLTFAFALQMTLAGCASIGQKAESIEEILQKENDLIGKVKAERALPQVQQGISQSEALQAAEAHLGVALEEIESANQVIIDRLINENKREVNLERHVGHDRD